MVSISSRVMPVVKWVGGKSQLLSEIEAHIPASFDAYHEPFVGGGALFFSTRPTLANLYDKNSSLILLYTILRDRPQELALEVSRLQSEFNSLDPEGRKKWFYDLRDNFNNVSSSDTVKSAQFLALNKTCFNGLYRENSKGKFNVPFNQAKGQVNFIIEDNFFSASEILQGTTLHNESFESVLNRAGSNDFVYFDPPYVPLTPTANFTSYNSDGFNMLDQLKLVSVAKELKNSGCSVVLSNSYTPWVIEHYEKIGFSVFPVEARRAIAAKTISRKPVLEALIIGN